MNTLLINNIPAGMLEEEFKKNWTNNVYIRETLHNTLSQLKSQVEGVKEVDFSIANHYQLLAFREGKKAAYDLIMGMLDINTSL
jgi:hypothetical protein